MNEVYRRFRKNRTNKVPEKASESLPEPPIEEMYDTNLRFLITKLKMAGDTYARATKELDILIARSMILDYRSEEKC